MPYTVYVYGIFILGYVTIFSRRCAELCGKTAVIALQEKAEQLILESFSAIIIYTQEDIRNTKAF